MKKGIILLLTGILWAQSFALASHTPDHAEVVKVSIAGLVCDFCARSLEKVFGQKTEVEAIDVNLTTKIVTLKFKPGASLADEQITTAITNAGYNVLKISHE